MMRYSGICCATLLLVLPVTSVRAQTTSPPGMQEPTLPEPTLREQNQDILNELRAIRQLLEPLATPQARSPQVVTVTNLKGFALGSGDAPLTMVEFSDLQCPFCREFALKAFEQIKRSWIETGKLRYIARDVPLDIHLHAKRAARAARCSGEQGKFWEMRTALMRNATLLSPDYITKTAADLQLDTGAFASCLAQKTFDADIQADMTEATRIGVRGTPTFVVGRTEGDALNGALIVGAQPYAVFEAKFRELLGTGTK